jgi:hypothetical protein
MLLAVSFSLISCGVKIPNAKTESAKIRGNCEMCKETIEGAIYKKKEAKGDWNLNSKIAKISYDSTKTDMDVILKRVALAGYDSDAFLAPDEAYIKLHHCCQYERTNKPVTSIQDTLVHDHSVGHDTLVQEVKDQLSALFESYFELKDALVMTDGAMASTASKKLLEEIRKVKMEALGDKQHVVWMEVMDALALDSENIGKQTDPKNQRKYFAALSLNMYKLIKVSKVDYTVYYHHCPMYNEGKGAYWLSKESTIKNPYYGSQMMSCGKTVETIK